MWVRGWIVAVATAGALVGCADAGTEPAAAPTSAAPAESHPSDAFLEPGWRFPDETVEAYRAALAEIDERLAQDEDVLRRAGEICSNIRRGGSDAEVVNGAATQFEVEAADARKIVDATRSAICSKIGGWTAAG